MELHGLEPQTLIACRTCSSVRATTARSASSSRSARAGGRQVDHLSLVAGCQRSQIGKLEAEGIATATALADASESHSRLRLQAQLQLQRRRTGEPVFELLEPEPESGFALLPDPSPGDLFFDVEGNNLYSPFHSPTGLSRQALKARNGLVERWARLGLNMPANRGVQSGEVCTGVCSGCASASSFVWSSSVSSVRTCV